MSARFRIINSSFGFDAVPYQWLTIVSGECRMGYREFLYAQQYAYESEDEQERWGAGDGDDEEEDSEAEGKEKDPDEDEEEE